MKLTRRELLAGVGAGIGALGVAGARTGRQPRYTHYTYAADGDVDDRRVRVAWYERYNGAFVETHAGETDPGVGDTLDPDAAPAYVDEAVHVTDASGPVLTVENVLPGDRGTLAVGLEVADDDALAEPVDVWLRGRITDDAENGVNEPELAAGDAAAGNGELDDELVVEVWRDDSPLGSCNGRKDGTELLGSSLVGAAPLSVAFGDSTAVGSEPGRRVYGSVAPGERRCLGLQWSLSFAAATNRSQGDGVAFDVQFGAAPTGADSPFSSAERR